MTRESDLLLDPEWDHDDWGGDPDLGEEEDDTELLLGEIFGEERPE